MRDTNESELHREGEVSGSTGPKLSECEKTVLELRELLKPGDTVYTKVDHVSRSGMTRWIEVYVIRDNKPLNISWMVSEVAQFGFGGQHSGVKVGGCGMDMGFHVVYSLSSVLYRSIGYDCIEDPENRIRCPAADHANMRDKSKIPSRHYDGYALRHRWL